MDINVCRVDLLSLIPKCAICEQTFDLSIRSPQILPCSHTFCLMCITKTCCICLECCVNNHNGHDLRRLICRTTPNRNLCRYDTKSSLTRTPLLPIKKASDTPSQASGCSQSISDSTSIRSSNWQENIPTEFKNIEQLESISNSGSFLENVNYTNRLNSDAVVSSTNSGQSSSFIKVQSNTIETDSLPEDGHIPNMPRRRHFRASRTALVCFI
uniref:RING-type domain-containing protein n=1 Tax=Syphacia muris TaxID=451379 RepID=A0A0N5AJY8_9BILA